VNLDTMLVSLYVLVDDWWERAHPPSPRKPGRPPSLSDAEVVTLAILSQWPRWRSERDFFRFADAHLRAYFPNLVTYGQFNRRVRALEPELKAFQRDLAETLAEDSEVYHVLDTTLIPAIVRVRAHSALHLRDARGPEDRGGRRRRKRRLAAGVERARLRRIHLPRTRVNR